MAEEGQVVNSTSGSGLDQNLAGALAYLFGWVTGIIFLVIEPNNKFVKFHAVQSILISAGMFIIFVPISVFASFLPGIIGLLVWCMFCIISIFSIVLWLFLMYKAYSGEMYKLPVIGDIAEKEANKIN